MTGRTAPCPSCGAPVEFLNAATVLVVCASCGGASWRKGFDLSLLGKVAEVTAIPSLLEIGSTGRAEGKSWTAVGQVQLDFGAGPWNEWCLLMADGSWAWLAEAQGRLYFTREVPRVPVPPHDRLHPGDAVDLGKEGIFLAAEVGKATVTAVKGEVPVRAAPGMVRLYADLAKGEKGFATLDFGEDRTCDAIYVGTTVAPAEVGLDPSRAPPAPERAASAERLQCPSCGGVLSLRDPEQARGVGCTHCGAVLDPTGKEAALVGAATRVKSKPLIPLGARGTIRGHEVECLAFLVRSVTVDGVRYPWSEYLLRRRKGPGYLWLVEAKGHWNLVEPASPGEAEVVRGVRARFRGRTYKHFQGGDAVVDLVYGEVYRKVRIGERVRSDDYVDPPRMVSVETDGKEVNVSLGTWIPPEEVQEAFRLERMPVAVGVAPNQPNPVGGLAAWWGIGLGVAGADVALSLAMSAAGKEQFGFPCCLTVPAILFPAVIQATRSSSFETKRWSESDHAPEDDGDYDSDD